MSRRSRSTPARTGAALFVVDGGRALPACGSAKVLNVALWARLRHKANSLYLEEMKSVLAEMLRSDSCITSRLEIGAQTDSGILSKEDEASGSLIR